MFAREASADVESSFRYNQPLKKPCRLVGKELGVNMLGACRTDTATQLVLRQSVSPFRAVKRGENERRGSMYVPARFGRMNVSQVQ